MENRWTTDPDYIDLLNFIIEKTKDVESPMSMQQMAREFKEQSGATQTMACLKSRIANVRTRIHNFENIDKNTKVKVLFALSASVDEDFLEEIKEDALVRVDEKNRITQYKANVFYYNANDESLELRGDHGTSAKNTTVQLESKRRLRSLTNNYFKRKNDADYFMEPSNEAYDFDSDTPVRNCSPIYIPFDDNFEFDLPTQRSYTPEEIEMREDEEYNSGITGNVVFREREFQIAPSNINHLDIELLNFLIEKTENEASPMRIQRLAREFKEESGAVQTIQCLNRRIHSFEQIDTNTKVRLLFALSASVDKDFLEKLKEEALVEVDEKIRITYYEANDGSLELRGDENEMQPPNTIFRESDPEYIDLLNYLIEQTENAESPVCIRQVVRDFKEQTGATQKMDCLEYRVDVIRKSIHRFEHIDTYTKVTLLFALSTPVDADFLEELKKAALVEVDEKNRITQYKANDGSFQLRKDNSHSAKTKTAKKNHTVEDHFNSGGDKIDRLEEFDSVFDPDYENDHLDKPEDLVEQSNKADDFDNVTPVRNRSLSRISVDNNFNFDSPTEMREVDEKDDSDMTGMVPPNLKHWTTDPEYIYFLNYLIEKTKDVKAPLDIQSLANEFKEKSGATKTMETFRKRINKVRIWIHCFQHINKTEKVKMMFALSAPVNEDFLKEIQKDALVEVDDKQRIIHYKANDGSLELIGDHSRSAKNGNGKRNVPSLINNYFKNKNYSNAVPANVEDREMWNFIGLINEKCENVNSPLSIHQLTEDFNYHFGTTRSLRCIIKRVRAYCCEIQTMEILDTFTKVKQLFCLSATLDLEYLEKLREDAVVEVDDMNRITKFTANDGRLTLHIDPSLSAKEKLGCVEYGRSGGEEGKESKKFERKFDSNNDKNHLVETENPTEPSNEAYDFLNDTPVRNLSPTFMSIDDNFDFDPLTQRSYRSDEIEMIEDEKYNSGITGNALFKAREFKKKAPPITNRWTTDPEYIELLNYLIKETENVESPMSIRRMASEYKEKSGAAQKQKCLEKRIANIRLWHHSFQHIDKKDKMKLLFALSAPVNADFLKELEKDAFVEVDEKKRIIYYKAIDGSLELRGNHSRSARNSIGQFESKRGNTSHFISNQSLRSLINNYFRRKNYSEVVPENEEEEESNEAYDFHNETPVRNLSPTFMLFDDNFDFDPPTQRSYTPEKIEMIEDEDDIDIETLPNTPKTLKRKAIASGPTSSKRTPSHKFRNPEEMNNHFSHDDPSGVKLKPFRGLLGLSDGIEEDADIEIIESPIEEKYEEEAHFSLKTVLKTFKSLILSLDTSGLSQFLMELDMKILEAGGRIEVPNDKVIVAMDSLILELTKHDAPESSEDSISLRNILLMIRTIILNLSFNGLEVILEMLEENIDQLKVQDKKVLVSKVDSVLSATLDRICEF